MKIPSPKPGMLRCTDWRPKFLTEFLILLMLDTGSRWLPLLSGSAPIHQRGKESIWFHLSLLWSGTSCLLSLTETVQYLNASRTDTARAAGLYFSQPFCACPPTRLSQWTVCCFRFQPLLRCTTSLEEGALKPTLVKPYVDTTLELNQKPSLMLELKSFRLKSVSSRTGKILSRI